MSREHLTAELEHLDRLIAAKEAGLRLLVASTERELAALRKRRDAGNQVAADLGSGALRERQPQLSDIKSIYDEVELTDEEVAQHEAQRAEFLANPLTRGRRVPRRVPSEQPAPQYAKYPAVSGKPLTHREAFELVKQQGRDAEAELQREREGQYAKYPAVSGDSAYRAAAIAMMPSREDVVAAAIDPPAEWLAEDWSRSDEALEPAAIPATLAEDVG